MIKLRSVNFAILKEYSKRVSTVLIPTVPSVVPIVISMIELTVITKLKVMSNESTSTSVTPYGKNII